jgi:release factor glutamine methyltransferase
VLLRDLLLDGTARLRAAGIDTADLDASLLLADALGISRAALYARLADVADADRLSVFAEAIDRRVNGESVAYIVGHKEFFGLDFAVSPAVLVPRPETELLVQWAVDWLRDRVLPARVVDVGTGSGAIAVTVAHAVVTAAVFACDVSHGALKVARRNARTHAVGDRIGFVCGDLLTWLGQPADLILANLPYLTDAQMTEPSIAAEPRLALVGGDADGFGCYRRLIPQAAARLMPGGAFVFEIDPAHAAHAVAACRDAFPTAAIAVHTDLAGHARFVTVAAPLDHLTW